MPLRTPSGVDLHVEVRGEGPSVVLVHGTTGSAAGWALVTARLKDRFRTVAYDRRGRGRSTDAASYSLEDELSDLDAVLAEHGPAHLVGHSFGARLALEVAARRDDLLSLTLYEPPLDPAAADAGFGPAVARATEARDWEGVLAAFHPVAGMPEEELVFFRSIPQVWSGFLDGARTVQREAAALAARPLDLALADRVTAPAQLLLGELSDSPVFLNGAEELASRMNAPVHRIPGQRHSAMAGAPEVLAERIAALAAMAG